MVGSVDAIKQYFKLIDTEDVSLSKHNERYHKKEVKNCKYRTPLVMAKVGKWLVGVDEKDVVKAIDRVLEDGVKTGWIVLRGENDSQEIKEAAHEFWKMFHDNVILLSDGRCVYFTPDERALKRGVDNATAWAEYSIHGVTSGGVKVQGKDYSCRSINRHKIENFDCIEPTIKNESCFYELHPHAEFDTINFKGDTHDGKRFEVVTRLDDVGNIYADLSEVTFEASSKKWKKLPRLMPLAEAIQTVVHHQAADTLP